MKAMYKGVLFTSFLVLSLILILSVRSEKLQFDLMKQSELVSFWPWAEGQSKILSSTFTSKGINCTFTLNEQSPYAGVTLAPKDTDFWDASKYEFIEVNIDDKRCGTMMLTISYFIEGFSEREQWQTHRITTQSIYNSKQKCYRFPIRELQTPLWWYRENNVQVKDVAAIDYAKIMNIGFSNGENQAVDTEQVIAIKSVRLINDQSNSATPLIVLLIVILLFLILFVRIRKKRKELPEMKHVILKNYADEEYERILTYMGDNFTNKGLTTGIVAEQTGINSSKVSELLHQFRSQSYHQFLNSLRLEEAKKLLRETDRNVSEIASHVGYAYVNSFNRVFKEFEKKTPLEYRSTNQ